MYVRDVRCVRRVRPLGLDINHADWTSLMTTLTTTEARDAFAEIVNRVAYRGERIVLERRGKHVAVLVSVDDLAILEALEDHLDIQAAHKALKEKGSIPWEKVKRDLGL